MCRLGNSHVIVFPVVLFPFLKAISKEHALHSLNEHIIWKFELHSWLILEQYETFSKRNATFKFYWIPVYWSERLKLLTIKQNKTFPMIFPAHNKVQVRLKPVDDTQTYFSQAYQGQMSCFKTMFCNYSLFTGTNCNFYLCVKYIFVPIIYMQRLNTKYWHVSNHEWKCLTFKLFGDVRSKKLLYTFWKMIGI